MRFIGLIRCALSGFAFVATLAGCSSAGSSSSSASVSPPLIQPQSVRRSESLSVGFADADAASTGAVIVSNSDSNVVNVYTMAGKLTAQITGLGHPEGLAQDTTGNLYIATAGNSDQGILVYKNDYKTRIAALSDPYPAVGVAVDNATGVVAAINVDPGRVANVMFYAKGATTPCATFPSRISWASIKGPSTKLITSTSPDSTRRVRISWV